MLLQGQLKNRHCHRKYRCQPACEWSVPSQKSGDVNTPQLTPGAESGDVSTPLAALALERREGRCVHTPQRLAYTDDTYTYVCIDYTCIHIHI